MTSFDVSDDCCTTCTSISGALDHFDDGLTVCLLPDETEASAIRDLSFGEVVEVYDALVRPSSGTKTRRTLSVQLISQQLDETPPDIDQTRLVVDESRFKAGLGCAPAVTLVVSEAFGEYTSVCAIL